MSKFIGRRVPVGIAPEGTRGTGVAPTHVLPKTSYDLEDKANKARSGESLGSISGEGSQAIVAQRMSEGSIESNVDVRSIPIILKSVFGSIASAAQSADYKHTLTQTDSNQHPSFSATIDDPNGDEIFEGCMIDTFELNVTMEDMVKFTAGIKAYPARDAAWTPSLARFYNFVGRDLEFKVAANVAGLAAATALCLKEMTLTINKNTEHDWCLGSLEPEDILNKQMSIQGSITLNYEDRTIRDYMLDGTIRAVGIKLTNTRETMGDQNPELYLELPTVDFSEWEADRAVDEIVTQTINFTALYDIANSRLISSCYVVSDVASY